MYAEGELHIPLRVARTGQEGTVAWKALCSCRSWGPPAASVAEAEVVLAGAHGSREPKTGCALCGLTVPGSATDHRPPWRRYRAAQGPAGTWEYVCAHRAECLQRCLERDDQTLHGESWLPTSGGGEDIIISLNEDITRAPFGVAGSIALYHHAQEECPRDWDDITTSPRDQRALAARVVALGALRESAETHQWHAILAARKSGVRWSHLGQLLAEDPDELRRSFVEYFRLTDWPWGAGRTPPDIEALLEEDATTD